MLWRDRDGDAERTPVAASIGPFILEKATPYPIRRRGGKSPGICRYSQIRDIARHAAHGWPGRRRRLPFINLNGLRKLVTFPLPLNRRPQALL